MSEEPVKRRRVKGEGSIFQRESDGMWCATLSVSTGTGRVQKRFYGKTQAEAREKLKAAQRTLDDGLPVTSNSPRVSAFMGDWIVNIKKPTLRPSSYRSAEGYVRRNINKHLGNRKLNEVTPQHVQKMLKDLSAEGYSPRTIQYIRTILVDAFTHAQRIGLLARNVAALTEGPRVEQPEFTPLTIPEARNLLKAIEGHRLETLYMLALFTALRQGELLALTWSDVDLELGKITCGKSMWQDKGEDARGRFLIGEPKTRRSRRTLPLLPLTVESLRAHRVRQEAERAHAEAMWDDSWNLIFCRPTGIPLNGQQVTRHLYQLLADAGLPHIRFHDLRHTAATLQLSAGVPLKVTSEALGHSTIAVTANIYSHVMPDLQREAFEMTQKRLLGNSVQNSVQELF